MLLTCCSEASSTPPGEFSFALAAEGEQIENFLELYLGADGSCVIIEAKPIARATLIKIVDRYNRLVNHGSELLSMGSTPRIAFRVVFLSGI